MRTLEEKLQLAKQGKDLDNLVHDENEEVRMAVAEHGRDEDLDILVNDESAWVRMEVVKVGRPKDLDILIDDKEKVIRNLVRLYLK